MRRQQSGSNIFLIIAAVIAGISILAAVGIFAYELYLKNARDQKSAALLEAQRAVDLDTVEGFIRLKNRLSTVEVLLNQHIALSEFFNTLESKTLQTVRFSGLTVEVNDDRSAEIQMEGVARTFNALAAQSSAIAAEKRIKRAIFSDISVNENGTVGFTLTASVDARLITSGEVLPGIPDTPAAPSTAVPAQSVPASSTTSPATTTRATTTQAQP